MDSKVTVAFSPDEPPEKLVAGRQAMYFRYFSSPEHFSDADVAHYAESYRDPEHLRTAFEFYRAFPDDEKFDAEQRTAIDLRWGAGRLCKIRTKDRGSNASARMHECKDGYD